MVAWPTSPDELEELQDQLARRAAVAPSWRPDPGRSTAVAGVFLASPSGSLGMDGEQVWAAAVVVRDARSLAEAVVAGRAGGDYRPGYLALREGPVLERAVRALGFQPDVVLVNASGLDHPRAAGLAVHLGAVLGVPTVGVTDRPLLARAIEPGPERGEATPLICEDRVVGVVVRTRRASRPVCVHAAWRTDPEIAREVVLSVSGPARTPEPLRLARRLARIERARAEGRAPSPRGRQEPGDRGAPVDPS